VIFGDLECAVMRQLAKASNARAGQGVLYDESDPFCNPVSGLRWPAVQLVICTNLKYLGLAL
jgi:hypothetical protein